MMGEDFVSKKVIRFLELAPKYIAAGSAPEIVIFFYIYLTTSLVAKILEMLLTFDSLAFFFLSKVQFFCLLLLNL